MNARAPHPTARAAGRNGSTSIAVSQATIAALPRHRRLGMWSGPVEHDKAHPPLLWLLGAHGGAGVSTLAQQIAPAADCGRRWPAVEAGESPFVVIVCRETIAGLSAAHDLLRQYHSGHAGDRVRVVGLVACAHKPGRTPKEILRYRHIIDPLVPARGRWRIDWQDAWPRSALADLPTWTPGDPAPAKSADPLAGIRAFAHDVVTQIAAVARERRGQFEGVEK